MKIFKQVTIAMILLLGFNSVAQKTTSKQVKDGLIEGYASFVESVRPFYSPKDSYESFKRKALTGDYTTPGVMPSLPAEGNNMLLLAYQYISKGLSYGQIIKKGNYQVMGRATLYVAKKIEKNKSSINAESSLFGGNEFQLNNNNIIQNRGGCKWWQIGCHIDSILGDGWGDVVIGILIDLLKDIL